MQKDNSALIPSVCAAQKLTSVSRWFSIATFVIGMLVLVGWMLNIEPIKTVLPGLVTMKVNAAVSLILLGVSLACLQGKGPYSKTILFGNLLLCVILSLLTVAEYFFKIDLHIDNLFIADHAAIAFPGRPAPTSLFCFLVLAISFLLIELNRGLVIAQLMLAVTIGVSMTTLGGYLYGAPQMLAHASYPVVAVHTAFAIILLALGALFKLPGQGLMRVLTADTTGGWIARRLIPSAMVVPLSVGLCVVVGQRAGLYSAAFSVALTVSADITVMTTTVWWVSSLLNQSDADRQLKEIAVAEGENRFRQLSDSMPQIVWAARPDGIIDYFNQRWYEFAGSDTGNQNWDYLLHPDDLLRCQTVYRAAIHSGTPYQIDMRFKDRQTGGYRWFLGRALPTRDAAGNIIRWYGTCTDIDEQKRVVEERRIALESERTARAEVERHSQLKDNFLATLSHELRTPLNAILGWSTLLRTRPDLTPDARDGLEVIERNARSQTQIVEDLLDMSRIISGKLRLDVQTVSLAKVIEVALQTAKLSAEAKRIQIDVEIDPNSTDISGDPNRMMQITWNLLSNAIKFTQNNGQVRISLARVASQMRLTIADNGKGISADFIPQLFGRFQQADGGITRRHGGLGLGLSIVRQLVELHGGTVKAESPGAGQGSTFTVSFPVIAARISAGDDAISPAAKVIPLCEDGSRIKGLRVLVVDDEPDARLLIRRILEDCDASVVTAGSADEAISKMENQQFDVLLSDIGMPDRTGYDLIRFIRQTKPDYGCNIPAAALTAYVRSEDRVRVLNAGFQMHVHKPVEAAELIAAVASLAGRPAA